MTKRIFITIILLSAAISASAQKKHAQAYLGAGYGIFSGDMYNAGGADFNIGIKYFATDYVFIDLTAQLGSSKGRKTQTINMNPPSATPMYTSDRFEHTLAEYGIMLGPGYNLYNNGQSRLYVKAQAGYTWGHEYNTKMSGMPIRAHATEPTRRTGRDSRLHAVWGTTGKRREAPCLGAAR